ncbi:rhodanese-like domain-containing protein [Alisedimentitalea sp. MJ-SS2]|uniref:rhodanese-like domain-containing protein n=1 Tax=Aliisedimentitalea sp. MJ-SS2 TaxID=3049795 RepID=UPI002915623E|nr:rhodanese-like domain-containing protein [Alisedimentitalea sp. MJ-SS2]MDU8926783.1 rhodanese-like domain-containing protein [Alisedimentitalea sp. MJ-SS2]
MTRKTYNQLAAEAAQRITEIMPWDVPDIIAEHPDALLLDIRERDEFARARIAGSLNVPRGILESAAEWDYAETEPGLVTARDKPVLIICRSGNRSAFAAETLAEMGFTDARSVKLGIKGWNDADQELIDTKGNEIDGDDAIELIEIAPRPDQTDPARR